MRSIVRTRSVKINLERETERILKQVLRTGNFDAGFEYINALYQQGSRLDGAIGIMVDGMEKEWRPEEHEGETFFDVAVRKTPLKPVTIRRHLKIKAFLDSDVIPENVRKSIEGADKKSLIRIANTAEDYELTDRDWGKIAESVASGEKSVSIVLRKVTDTAPRSNWFVITMDDIGRLVVHSSESHIEFGKLNVRNPDPLVQKAISRLRGDGRIQDHVEY